jgi:formate--tetrahydrofolate ligase
VAARLGLDDRYVEPYGSFKAKVSLALLEDKPARTGTIVLVSAITPTPAGEGKTTVSIGLGQALCRLGDRAVITLRQPSLGPCLGIKGGATGGGRSQVLPADDINLHFTGDFHAVTSAHNLLAALVDNHAFHGNRLGIDPRRVLWRRVTDMNDRSLRQVVIGLGGTLHGVPRETGYDITAASEVMAVLCLARGYADLKKRLGAILVAFRPDGSPVFASDLKAEGAMAALLRDALKPNLVQTTEGTPAFVHGGPFANIAHGTSSLVAAELARAHADWVVTEAGFGFDLGAEKFFHILCRQAGFAPHAVVLVATVRALKHHGGVALQDLAAPDPAAVSRGLPNLVKHLENIIRFRVPAVVAINRFEGDAEDEIDVVTSYCRAQRWPVAVVDVWSRGGEGALELAALVRAAAETASGTFEPLYAWEEPVVKKIETVARSMYGANAVTLSRRARADLAAIERFGYAGLPVCIAKTQKSLSDDPVLLGRPKDFVVTVREIAVAAGAGFLIPITGDILRMPGLPAEPAAERIDLTDDGTITGLR